MEEAAVKPVRALKKRCRDWQLAVRHHGLLKKWNQGNGGSWKKLTAACRGMTRCAIPAPEEVDRHLQRDDPPCHSCTA
jgi:hypothetical protein